MERPDSNQRKQPEGADHGFDANALSDEAIAALKQKEAAGRDAGSKAYLDSIRGSRSAFRRRVEELTLFDAIAPRRAQVVLDAGAGVGRFALAVAPHCARIVCVDISSGALDVLSREATRRGLSNVTTIATDLCDLPPLGEPFDTVYSFETFQHIPSHRERVRALKNLHGAMKPGGRLVLSALCWNERVGRPKEGFWGEGASGAYCHYFTPDDMHALLGEAGFARARLRGMLLLPGRMTRRWPLALAFTELWLSKLGAGVGAGRFLIAIARAS